MMKKWFFLVACLLIAACDRDNNSQTATLTVTNNTDLGTAPLSIWSIYITPATSTMPALDRSPDLLASVDLAAGASRTFTIDTCGQPIDVQIIFSNGSEQQFSSAAAVTCDSTYVCVVDDLGVLTCS